MDNLNKKYVSQQEYTQLIELVREYAEKLCKPDIIVGVARGGLIPAVYLSHSFNIPLRTIHWNTRDHQDVNTIDESFFSCVNGKNVLVVDDICDTGKTLQEIHRAFVLKKINDSSFACNLQYVCLHQKVGAKFPINYAAETIDDEAWIVYPYEIDKTHERGYN